MLDFQSAFSSFPHLHIYTFLNSAACYNHDTKILCFNDILGIEEYKPVQDLKKGDLVKTYLHGYKKVDCFGKGKMNNIPNLFSNCMYKMEKTIENGLTEDLIMTGGHSILVDTLTTEQEESQLKISFDQNIDGKKLLLSSNSELFQKITEVKRFSFYSFSLENEGDNEKRFGVYANGMLVEVSSKNWLIEAVHKYENVIY